MSESSTPERALPAIGFVQAPFWGAPVDPAQLPAQAPGQLPGQLPVRRGTGGSGSEPHAGGETGPETGPGRDRAPFEGADGTRDAPGDGAEEEPGPGPDAELDGDDGAGAGQDLGEESGQDLGEESGGESGEDSSEDSGEEPRQPSRFEELVEEHVRRARYAHHLTRPIFTPEESVMAVLVERRAAVWVPTMTFVATVVSAVATVVLATRLRSDPTDPSGNQLFIVTVTVCLLAAAFATLIRAEVHYERLRPRGRVVRHDVADAYDLVRDAPRRLVRHEAPVEVLRRVAGLLPTAERLVDALASYTLRGGTQVRAHPAYERIIRMRAEVEALELLLKEQREREAAEQEGRPEKPVRREPPPMAGTVERVTGTAPRLPPPEQVPDYTGLEDLATTLTGPDGRH